MAGRRSLTPLEERMLIVVTRKMTPRDGCLVTCQWMTGYRISEVLRTTVGTVLKAERALLVASEAVNRTQPIEMARKEIEELINKHSELEGNWVDLWVRTMICRWTGGIPTEITDRETTLDLRVNAVTAHVKSLRTTLKTLER